MDEKIVIVVHSERVSVLTTFFPLKFYPCVSFPSPQLPTKADVSGRVVGPEES